MPTETLSPPELTRLTRYKWRYALESLGFTTEEAHRLIFLRWLMRREKGLSDGQVRAPHFQSDLHVL